MAQFVIGYFNRIISVTVIFLIIAGCQRGVYQYDIDSDNLPSRVESAQDPAEVLAFNRLTKQGVRVISIGQDYLVSIPASLLFANQSPRIRWESYALLNDVVCYIKQFRKIGVNVSAFSSKYVSPMRERALTYARARTIADYLWSQDIHSRFIFTRGLGSDKPIFLQNGGGDGSLNARVEITFRNAVA